MIGLYLLGVSPRTQLISTEPGPEGVRFADLDRDPINVQDGLAGQRRDPAARSQDTDEVEGIGRRD